MSAACSASLVFQTKYLFWILLSLIFISHVNGQDGASDGIRLQTDADVLSRELDYSLHHHFVLGIISDNDEKSKSKTKPNVWESKFVRGKLFWDANNKTMSVEFDKKNTKLFQSSFNAGGRGMELSELIYYENTLMAMDDKTGLVFKILNGEIFPWVILITGDGHRDKGFKCEWATVKSGKLYVGSHGIKDSKKKEDLKWVKVISGSGAVENVNWKQNYDTIQNFTKCYGFLTHEAVCWSDIQQKWFFLPRKCSAEAYSGKKNYDLKGNNILITADDKFEHLHQTQVGALQPSVGFSSFKFLPNSSDDIIVALKTTEVDEHYKTFITAFRVSGEILLEDTLISDVDKFEGLEFIHEDDPILKYVAPLSPSGGPNQRPNSFLATCSILLLFSFGLLTI